MDKESTYNAPVYFVGRGATIDLLILVISACISCSRNMKLKNKYAKETFESKWEE